MANGINQDARALWIFMRNDGGWWSVKQLTYHWRPTFCQHEVDDHMRALCSAGFLARGEGLQKEPTYCFTSDCHVLPGAEVTS